MSIRLQKARPRLEKSLSGSPNTGGIGPRARGQGRAAFESTTACALIWVLPGESFLAQTPWKWPPEEKYEWVRRWRPDPVGLRKN